LFIFSRKGILLKEENLRFFLFNNIPKQKGQLLAKKKKKKKRKEKENKCVKVIYMVMLLPPARGNNGTNCSAHWFILLLAGHFFS
jgi:hypothetical protein